ncbi:MAG: tetratricopeptide repeat protein [Opitutaceae bacterium]|jgi:tetratricopeptide (TPR) repeat protein
MDWKPELDAIVGARHGGAGDTILSRLQDLDRRHPNVAEIAYQVAWSKDVMGNHAEAVPCYEKAISLGLPPNDHAGALIGLSACLLLTGNAAKAEEVLASGRALFPENREFEAFQALALHAKGKHAEALEILLVVLAETSVDRGIAAYQRTLRHVAARVLGAHN